MEKAVPQGSLIINQWSEDKNFKIGDIITYRRPDLQGFFITHRIIAREKDGLFYFFKTQGDQVPEPDRWRINQSLIEGKVIFTIPLLGYLYAFVQSPPGFLLFIFLPAGWLIFEEIKNIKKELKKQKTEKQKNIKILLFFLTLALFSLRILPTYAYFSSSPVSLTGINLEMSGQPCASEFPVLEILADYQKQANFNLNFSSCDNLAEIQEVRLYYARDPYSSWVYFGSKFPEINPASGSFSFNSPEGDGFYRFLTIAIDEAGKIEGDADDNGVLETTELDLLPADTWTVVDTEAPITALSVNQTLAVINEQIYNGGFENANLDGWTTAGDGNHQATQAAVKSGAWSALIGNATSDSISKTIFLSSDITSTLSFWYRLLTDDVVSGGFFDAAIKKGSEEIKIVHNGWDDPTITETDPGWKNVVYQLNNLLGQNIDLQFKVSQPNDGYKTWAYLDEIRVTAATNSATASSQINLASHDASGSGVAEILYQIDGGLVATYSASFTLVSGTHSLAYFAKDEAGNNEATRSMTINATESASVDFGVALNEFLPNPTGDDYASAPNGEWVELYNNNITGIDVDGWKLKDNSGHELIINASKTEGAGTIIAPAGKLKIYRRGSGESSGPDFVLNNTGDTVTLLKQNNTLVDSFTYTTTVEGKSYKRSPDGTGTWKDPIVEPITVFLGEPAFPASISVEMLSTSVSSDSAVMSTPILTPIPLPAVIDSVSSPSATVVSASITEQTLTLISEPMPTPLLTDPVPAETAVPLTSSSPSPSSVPLSDKIEASTFPITNSETQATPSPNPAPDLPI